MICIVFGPPGSGKTCYLNAIAVPFLNNSTLCLDLLLNTELQVNALRSSGLNLSLPKHAPVYTNYDLHVDIGREIIRSYYIDGFHLGFENPDVDVMPVYPGSKIFLSEAQRYYNSRNRQLPDWVSRFYEEHRHFGLDIYLDCQRPDLIDANIREITSEFVEMIKTEVVEGQTILYFRRYSSWSDLEKCREGQLKMPEVETKVVPFVVFDYYESCCYYNEFVPKTDFWQFGHVLGNTPAEINLAKTMYRQIAPPGFYKEKRK